jgi:hypothetical protein
MEVYKSSARSIRLYSSISILRANIDFLRSFTQWNRILFLKPKVFNHPPFQHNKPFCTFRYLTRYIIDSTIAVLGFVIQLCSEFTDPFLSSVFASIEDIAIPGTYTTTGPLDFEGLEKHFLEHNVYTYNGSLTIPPCSEGINWLISAEPLLIDVKTYNRVKKIVKFNSRYTQNTLGQTNLLEVEANTLARG